MEKSCLVPIGKVVKTHGIRGAVKIHPYGETLGELEAGAKVLSVASGGAMGREFTLVSLRAQKRDWIGEFEEIGDMDSAREIVGIEVGVPRERLPALPDGEYYQFQLIGLTVETGEGGKLGILRGIFETGGHDVYVVDCDGKELLVPAIEDVICEIDLENNRMIVDLPEGLE
jgi:16S rRNA processing protein RimM